MQRVDQDGCKLPVGPILMSPDFLIDSAKREVLFKTPEGSIIYFICSYLENVEIKNPKYQKDIRKLLSDNPNPFLAGFGRENQLYYQINDF